MSIQYLHQKLWNIKIHQTHQQKREPQRTPAGKRTESPRHGQGTEFQGKCTRSKRWNASRRTTFIELSLRDSIVLACYGHARWYTSTARQKKGHRGVTKGRLGQSHNGDTKDKPGSVTTTHLTTCFLVSTHVACWGAPPGCRQPPLSG